MGREGVLSTDIKVKDVKVPHKLETFNLQYTNFKTNGISSAPVESENEGKGVDGGQ